MHCKRVQPQPLQWNTLLANSHSLKVISSVYFYHVYSKQFSHRLFSFAVSHHIHCSLHFWTKHLYCSCWNGFIWFSASLQTTTRSVLALNLPAVLKFFAVVQKVKSHGCPTSLRSAWTSDHECLKEAGQNCTLQNRMHTVWQYFLWFEFPFLSILIINSPFTHISIRVTAKVLSNDDATHWMKHALKDTWKSCILHIYHLRYSIH